MGLNPLGANSVHAPLFFVHPLPDSREGLVALVGSRFVRDGGIRTSIWRCKTTGATGATQALEATRATKATRATEAL